MYLWKEHNDIKTVRNLLKYYEKNWSICVDLKMVNFLFGQQRGFMKYPCFICMLDSWAKDKLLNQRVALTQDSENWYSKYFQWSNLLLSKNHISFSAHQAGPDETVCQSIKYWQWMLPTHSFSVMFWPFDPAKNAIQGGAPEGSDTSRSLEIGRSCAGVEACLYYCVGVWR